MKKIFLIIGITSIILAAVFFKRIKTKTVNCAYNIGILQTASHPALDSARDGFVEQLKNQIGNDVCFVIKNAQGSVAKTHAFAQQFHANKQLNCFFAIATPAAQAMGSVEKERPVIIAAVTDAQTLGLIHPTTNISGTSDMIDVEAEIKMVAELIPNAKTVGILYSSGETNSILMVKQMHQQLAAQGLKAIDFAISNEADISTIVDVACRKSDVIVAPTDNTVAATITLISNIANKYKKPLIVSDNMLVKFGPLAARGVDYKECGKKSAQIAYDIIIGGKKPQDITITQVQNSKIFVNQNTLDTLGLVIPETLKNDVVLITQD